MTETKRKTQIKIVSPLEVRVNGYDTLIQDQKFGESVMSIDLPDGRSFTVGQTSMFNKIPYKINTIEKNQTSDYTLRVANRTKSSLLLMPMFNGDKRLYMYDKLLLNCFIGKNLDTLVLVYRFSGEATFLRFESALKSFKNFILSEDPNEYCVKFEFSVPNRLLKDFDCFIEGRYSEFSTDYKMQILKFHDLDIQSQIASILFKSESRRLALNKKLGVTLDEEAELLSIINTEKEIFNFNDYF